MNKQSDVVSLVNISTQKWPPRHRTYFGSLTIQSPEAGVAYAVTPVRACTSLMDLGDKRTMEIRLSAQEIAEDLVREINGDSGEGSYHGVFVAAGPDPTTEELAEARRKLEAFQTRLVETADLEWERSHNMMFITDLEPWLYDPKPMADCPACGKKIRPGVAVCRTCGAILDREKAAKFGLAGREEKNGEAANAEGEKVTGKGKRG